MELSRKEILALQEKLVIVYRFISQDKSFQNFYCQGLEVDNSSKEGNDDSSMLTKLLEFDDSEELLKNCIIELQDMKEDEEPLTPEGFQDFILSQDWNKLYKKYGMKTLEDAGKLDLEVLLELL